MFICRTRSRMGGPPGSCKGFGCLPRTSKYPREVTVKVFDGTAVVKSAFNGTAAVVLSVPRVRLGTPALGIALLPAHFHGSTPIIPSLSFGRLLRPPALDEMAPMKQHLRHIEHCREIWRWTQSNSWSRIKTIKLQDFGWLASITTPYRLTIIITVGLIMVQCGAP